MGIQVYLGCALSTEVQPVSWQSAQPGISSHHQPCGCESPCAVALTPNATLPHLPLRIKGITLSPNQVARGTALAAEKGLANCEFKARRKRRGWGKPRTG